MKKLSAEERKEYNVFIAYQDTTTFDFWSRIDIYRLSNGRKMLTVASKYFGDTSNKTAGTKKSIFPNVDRIPTFPGCSENDRACFSTSVQKFIAEEFDASLPKKVGLSSGTKKMKTTFTIGKDGTIKNIDIEATENELKTEMKRVVAKLPKMIPAEQNGKKVAVKYSLSTTIFVK